MDLDNINNISNVKLAKYLVLVVCFGKKKVAETEASELLFFRGYSKLRNRIFLFFEKLIN